MRILLPTAPIRADLSKPTLQFFEEPEGMRIECQGQPTKYLSQKNAIALLKYLGTISFEKERKFTL